MPTGGIAWLWFLSVVAFTSFSLLASPFFKKPADVLSASIAGALLLWSLGEVQVPASRQLELLRLVGIGVNAIAGVLAGTAIIGQRSAFVRIAPYSKAAYRASGHLGSPAVLFTIPAMIGAYSFIDSSTEASLVLAVAWVLIVVVRPLEIVWLSLLALMTSRSAGLATGTTGRIIRIDSPNILRVALEDSASWNPKGVQVARLADSTSRWVLPLFSQVQEAGLIGTGLCVGSHAKPPIGAQPNFVYQVPESVERAELIRSLTKTEIEAELVGFVVEESRISPIRFEVAVDTPLHEGALVFCRQLGKTVYYQIMGAQTTEESFERNPRGTHIVIATQLGVADIEAGFQKYSWLPRMNTPVFLAKGSLREESGEEVPGFALGVVPKSDLVVRGNLEGMHEFHTAVLGVTGTGKTELAYDIIREARKAEAKVVCVDFTGEYAARLEDLSPEVLGLAPTQNQRLKELILSVETGEYGGAKEKAVLEEFVGELEPEITKQVDDFLQQSGAGVGIFELPDIANTRATLRATELYLSRVFDWARQHRGARKILVVLEEAHTVIPEMNFFRYDKSESDAVVGRMGQIALQGRKYGVGLLIISQRTALVSKTLLSQCNTVISFGLVDKTSLDYLANVFGSEHVKALPNLPARTAIAHGKGVLSERPVLIEMPFDPEKAKAAEALRRPIDTAASEAEPGTTEAGEGAETPHPGEH